MGNEKEYAVGDWIVHLRYGVGQIVKLEKRVIGGKEQMCYRVHTDDSIFWIPINASDNKRIRSIATPERIQRALKMLEKTPDTMNKDYKVRRKRIREAITDGSLVSAMELVRDLHARKVKKGLNPSEQEAMDTIIKRFLQEWSLSKGIKMQEARQKFNHYLVASQTDYIQPGSNQNIISASSSGNTTTTK
jgi:RNA polymerase-interacting CarD/CdnL/TRCF family regulator